MSGFAAHRLATSSVLVGFALTAIVLGSGDPVWLGGMAAASLFSLLLFTREAAQRALDVFASPLAILADLGILMALLVRTGGLQSPAALLLPAGLALAWHLEGRPAARFHALLSPAAIGTLIGLGALSPGRSGLLPALAAAFAAPALLAGLELASRLVRAPEAASRSADPVQPAASKAARAAAAVTREPRLEEAVPERRLEEEILHDLRSPLSVIRVYSELIGEGARRGELPNPEHVANLARELDLAERLVGTADVGRRAGGPGPAAPPPAPADLVEILGSLATAYRLSLAGKRRIEFIAEKPELTVAADAVPLQRAFRNVLENAVKYTAEGGEIRIRAGAAGPHAFVVVKDTGIGMSPEERTHAFDYAFRGSGAVATGVEGKGIGLAVTKEILEANGGRISLSSEAGFGSEVTILLPFARGQR